MLENPNQIFGSKIKRELNPRLRVFLGGFLLLGVFACIFALNTSATQKASPALLKSEVSSNVPIIESIVPTSGQIGSPIYITGKKFSEAPNQNLVKFGDQEAVVKTVGYSGESTMRIIAIVPNLTLNENYAVTVKNQNGTAISDAQFTVTAGQVTIPSITRFEPTSGYPGDKIYLYGDNLAAKAVDNIIELENENGKGIRASQAELVHIANDIALKFTIPEGAITGKIYLTVGGVKTESGNKLQILTELPAQTPTADLAVSNTTTPVMPAATPAKIPNNAEVLAARTNATESQNLELNSNAATVAKATTSPIAQNPAQNPIEPKNIPQQLQLISDTTGWRLSWTKPLAAGLYTYNIYYSTQSGQYLHRFAVDSVTTSPITPNLVVNQHYFFVVTAVDPRGLESAYSNEVSLVFDGRQPPMAPTVTEALEPILVAPALVSSPELHAAPTAELAPLQIAVAPVQLSQEGPAATLLIAGFVAILLGGWFFSQKKALLKK